MKRTIIGICVAAVFVPEIVLAGNCGNGQGGGVGNTHCGQAPRVPATSLSGVRPAQNTKPPTQVGGIIPDPHNTVLVPLQPPAQQTPPPVAIVAPPQILPPQKTPMVVPPQPPAQQTPTPVAVVAPPQILPPQKTPMLVPPQPVAQQTPQQVPMAIPQPVLPPQKTPMLVPPQPVAQQTPQQVPMAIPQPVLPPQQTPMLVPTVKDQQPPTINAAVVLQLTPQTPVPPQKTPMLVPPQPGAQQIPPQATVVTPPQVLPPQKTPPQVPTAIPQPVTTPSALAGSGAVHGNALLVHAPDTPKPVTSGRIAETSAYTLEFIEPGLQSRKVKVYRTNDAAEQVYKDTIPLDQGGFQIIVVGTRNPDYIH